MKRIGFWIVAIAPAIILSWLIWRYSVDIPLWDQWDTPGKLIATSYEGTLTIKQWMAQHNESRPLFPKIVFLALAKVTNWNNRYEMLVTFILACLVSINIYFLSKKTFSARQQHLSCFALSNLIIFSPLQQENWLWGFQGVFFTSILAITSSFLVIFSPSSWAIKVVVSSLLSLVATFSFANGVLCWLVIFPALILKAIRDKITKKWLVFYWLAAFSATFAIYIYDYSFDGSQSSAISPGILTQVSTFASYYLTVIGSPILHYDLSGSQQIGILLLLALAIFGFYLWTQRRNTELIDRATPWLLISLYVLSSTVLIAVGRMDLDLKTALAQRYITVTTYFVVALIYLLNLVANQFRQKTLKRIIFAVLLILYLITYKDNFATGIKSMHTSYYHRVHGKTCVVVMDIIRDEECLANHVYPNVALFDEQARRHDRFGLIQPGIVSAIDWQDSLPPSVAKLKNYGEIDKFAPVRDGSYVASGWTLALQAHPSFDSVILTYPTPDNPRQAFAIASLNVKQRWKMLFAPQQVRLTWEKTILPENAPPAGSKVTAWAFDTDEAKAYLLNNSYL